jgi:hypothetical protein
MSNSWTPEDELEGPLESLSDAPLLVAEEVRARLPFELALLALGLAAFFFFSNSFKLGMRSPFVELIGDLSINTGQPRTEQFSRNQIIVLFGVAFEIEDGLTRTDRIFQIRR